MIICFSFIIERFLRENLNDRKNYTNKKKHLLKKKSAQNLKTTHFVNSVYCTYIEMSKKIMNLYGKEVCQVKNIANSFSHIAL